MSRHVSIAREHAEPTSSLPGRAAAMQPSRTRERAPLADGHGHSFGSVPLYVQRKCKGCEEEETIRREPSSEARAPGLDPALRGYLASSAGRGRPIDAAIRQPLESSFQRSFADVRVIDDGQASRAADALSARAFTVGSTIWFGHGEYRPEHPAGRRLLAHELAHTVQQQGSSGGAPQRELAVGKSTDPAEAAADRAADAVMRGESAQVGAASGLVLRRALKDCRAEVVAADELLVTCEGDKRFKVTYTVEETTKDKTTVSADKPTIDDENIGLRIKVCNGRTKVIIDPKVNLPEVVVQVIGNTLRQDPAFKDVLFRPRLRVQIMKSGAWVIWTEGHVDIDPTGKVKGGGVGVGTQIPGGEIEGSVIVIPDIAGKPAPGISGKITWGGSKPEEFTCPTETEETLKFTCAEITKVPGDVIEPKVDPTTDKKSVFAFFQYAKALYNPDDKQARAEVAELGKQGYTIVEITGHCSPEGSLEKINTQLAKDRATAAETSMREACPQCFSPEKPPTIKGEGELFGTRLDDEGKPVERKDSELDPAIDEYIDTDKLKPADPVAFRRQSRAVQRKQAWDKLRRAEIKLERKNKGKDEKRGPDKDKTGPSGTCDAEVVRAAKRRLKIPM